ncbi:hypothetical protein C8F01DRAFT_1081814 [Mycena amicta]|nr:hypothetical protein C8F01DRAFT_1081814 [Mycena amicta]
MSRPSRSGLPSGPGPRSRSAVRNRYDDDDRSDTPSQSRRQVRPQKSLNSMKSESSQPPPPMPSRSRNNPAPSYDTRASDSNRSSDSTASSTSSFLDRMRGYASSRTSLDEDPPAKPSARSMRSKASRAETPPPGPEDDAPGDGYTLWSKVASAASSLTVNVGKAWTSNVSTFSGEETPPGQESRLTRAMKAYHIEKARDPSDLPKWLFDEKERRGPAPEPSRSSRRRDDDQDAEDDDNDRRRPRGEPPQSRGLRDIYEAAAATSTTSDRSTRGVRSYADETPQPSRATDRLKALRDAKRSAVNPNVGRRQEEEGGQQGSAES